MELEWVIIWIDNISVFWTTYYFYETIFIILVIIFIVNYKKGIKKNQEIALNFISVLQNVLMENFKFVGKKTAGGSISLYEWENTHIFKICATGNEIMSFFLMTFYIKNRENLFNYYLYDTIFPTKERMIFEVGVKMKNKSFVCFGVVRKNQIKKLSKEGYPDLKNMCSQIELRNVDKNLAILTEYVEVAEQILTPDIINLMNQVEKYIHIIYVSDVEKDPAAKVNVKVMTNISTANDIETEDYTKVVTFVCKLCESVSFIKLSQQKQLKSQNARRKFRSKFKED